MDSSKEGDDAESQKSASTCPNTEALKNTPSIRCLARPGDMLVGHLVILSGGIICPTESQARK
jgi:hypothetical protein